jgi:hypothetical protein
MTGSPTPKGSDALELLEQLTGSDAELHEKIFEERLVLQVAQAAHLFRERARRPGDELAFYYDIDPRTLAELERGGVRTQAVQRLQRIAWRLELDVRLVLVPRPRNGRRKRVADIARLR